MWRKADRMYDLASRFLLWSAFGLTITNCFQTFVIQKTRSSPKSKDISCRRNLIHGTNFAANKRFQHSFHILSLVNTDTSDVNNNEEEEDENQSFTITRRSMLQGIAMASSASMFPLSALAGQPEVDKAGMLYSPKSEMLSGGSQAARGIPVDKTRSGEALKPGQALQSVYGTRFITYLSRFLLNFDPAARAWGENNGLVNNGLDRSLAANKFAEFAESVEVGLADYFVGPYGSYSSVSAAKAGLLAAGTARSSQPQPVRKDVLGRLVGRKQSNTASPDNLSKAKQGVLNLLALLKARYSSVDAKMQLSILFSLITSPRLQPTAEIRSLLGEVDNATISQVDILSPRNLGKNEFRTSSRLGGGYSFDSQPRVEIEPPPALGDAFKPAKLQPIMQPTSRILRINLIDGGEGYSSAPSVTILQPRYKRACQACAIMDRRGHVESILVLDPGLGYREEADGSAPKVIISPPRVKQNEKNPVRQATAVAELEYGISRIDIIEGGNGYVASEPPRVYVSPPEDDPDWFLVPPVLTNSTNIPNAFEAQACATVFPGLDDIFASDASEPTGAFSNSFLNEAKQDPLKLLPSSNRPVLQTDLDGATFYVVPDLPVVQQFLKVPSPRYRAFDPIFGGVGIVPVTKGASGLSASEYGRLALSGAVCTVVVRTLLNPLELVKTKQQLENDEELFSFARDRMRERMQEKDSHSTEDRADGEGECRMSDVPNKSSLQLQDSNQASDSLATEQIHENVQVVTMKNETVIPEPAESTVSLDEESQAKVGTITVISCLIALRGPLALFQSADITLLASLVFGSFGFGATELFRRYFTSVFFTGDELGSSGSSEVTLLLAAGLATVITSAAASPFEVLRVRSMGLLESQKWTAVLQDFLNESKGIKSLNGTDLNGAGNSEFSFKNLKPRDAVPLFSGFAPILSRELPFSIAKFLTFDVIARTVIGLINDQAVEGALPVQVGVGPTGLAVSAMAGALAGIVGAIVSHPSDLILTITSASKKKKSPEVSNGSSDHVEVQKEDGNGSDAEWLRVLKELISREGGVANLFVGLPARATFFFLVIGLQFFLYDYVKGLFQVGTDDLDLVLDVFYAVRTGLP